MSPRFLALPVLCLFARGALAEPRVVIIETSDAVRFESLAQLVGERIGSNVTVTTVSSPDAVDASRVTAVVMLAPLPGGDGVLVQVGERREPVRFAPGVAPKDAAVAIADTIATLLGPLAETAAPVVEPPLLPYTSTIDATAPRRWSLAASGAVVRENGAREWDGRVAARLTYRGRSIGTWAAVYWQLPSDIGDGTRSVRVQEVGGRLGLVVERSLGAWSIAVGPHATVGVQSVRLQGAGGAEDTSDTVVALGADFGAAFALTDRLHWFATFEPEFALQHQRYTVDDQPVADLGRARFAVASGFAVDL